MKEKIPENHPRASSLQVRRKLVEQWTMGVVASSGLIAHGRGEAFDYLLGERSTEAAIRAANAAAALLIAAQHPVISVNGNVAALASKDVVNLSDVTGAKIEVNLFYRSDVRERAIEKLLKTAGADEILGVGNDASAVISELGSERRRVDPSGILIADVVLVPLEDGDRTEALLKMQKKVIAIDLNPLSRTAQKASITIVDNITRAAPKLVEAARLLKRQDMSDCKRIIESFNNTENLSQSIALINNRLSQIVKEGRYLSMPGDLGV